MQYATGISYTPMFNPGLISAISVPGAPFMTFAPTEVLGTQNLNLKRKRDDTTSFVKLSRDELLQMSSQEYEEYVKKLSQNCPLSSTEQREVKRQRRLIKNREYAQTSRNKKKEFVSAIQTQLDSALHENELLKNENQNLNSTVSDLSSKISLLEEKNRQVESENMLLKEALLKSCGPVETGSPVQLFPSTPSSAPSSPSSEELSSNSEFDQFFDTSLSESEPTGFPQSAPSFLDSHTLIEMDLKDTLSNDILFQGEWTTPSVYAGITYLFIVMFSFGLFFGGIPGSSLHLPQSCDDNGPQVTYPQHADNPGILSQNYRTSRTLKTDSTKYTVINTSDVTSKPVTMFDVLLDEGMNIRTGNITQDLIWHNCPSVDCLAT